jgi:hypothetical protein
LLILTFHLPGILSSIRREINLPLDGIILLP